MTDINPFQGDAGATSDLPPVTLAGARGLRNNNPGNIKVSGIQWNGQVPGNDPTFVTFDSPESGIAALAKNLMAYQQEHGINTIAGLVKRWAPASDSNNVNAYIKSVSEQTGIGPNEKLNLSDPGTLSAIVPAIIQHENGKNPYDNGTLMGGISYALNGINPAKVQWDASGDSAQPQDLGGVKVPQGAIDPFAGDKQVVAPVTAQPAPQTPAKAAAPSAPVAIDPAKVQWDAPAKTNPAPALKTSPAQPAPATPAPGNSWDARLAQTRNQLFNGFLPVGAAQWAPHLNMRQGMQAAGNFLQGVNHGIMTPLHGLAQMVEHGVAGAANLLPDNPITRAINNTVSSDDAALRQMEQNYQNRTQGSVAAPIGDISAQTLASLMATGFPQGGAASVGNSLLSRLGNFAGDVGKSALGGAAVAATQPVTNAQANYWLQKADQAKAGAVIGGALPVAGAAGAAVGKGIGYGKNVLQSLVDPFTNAGQTRIAGNILSQFAKGGATAINDAEIIPESHPTLAQATGNAGLSSLERGLQATDPNTFGTLAAHNQAARSAHVEGLTGNSQTLGALEQARDQAAMPLLQNAFANAGKANPQGVLAQIDSILSGPGGGRDSVQSVLNNIKSKLVDAQGNVLPEANDPSYLYQTVRKQIGDLLDKRAASTNPAGQQASRELLQVRDALDQDITKAAPDFGNYLQAYADASKPINAQTLLQGLNLTDATGNYTLAKVQNALNGIQKQMQAPGANNAKSLSAAQLNALSALRDDLLRQSNSALGKGIGSNTFQNLATNNIMSSMLPGKAGQMAGKIPLSVVGGALGSVAGPMGTAAGAGLGQTLHSIYRGQDPAIMNKLIGLMLDPAAGGRALNNSARGFLASQPAQNRLMQRLTPYLIPGVVLGGTKALSNP
jgi:hypothetical protein